MPRAFSDRSPPAFPTASSKPSTATCRPPSARPKATEASEISKPSSTSSPETFWPIHPLEIATSRNDNWEHLLYVRTGNGWRNIFVDVFQDSLIRRCTSTHGLPDLEVWHHASASEGDQVVYRFDGKVYKEAECIQQLYDTVSEKPYTAPCQIPSDFLAMF